MLPYICVVRLNTLISPRLYNGLDGSNGIISNQISTWIPNALVQNIFAIVLIFFQAVLINQIFIKNRLSKEITLFAGIGYIIFVSIISENSLLSPLLIANTFMILAVSNLLNSFKHPEATANIFNSGFFIGLAALIYTPYFIFTIFGLVSLMVLRSFKAIEKVQFFIGFSLPYFLSFTIKYWYDIKFSDFDFLTSLFFNLPAFSFNSYIIYYICILFVLLSVLVVLLKYNVLTSKKNVQSQKKVDIFYWLMLICFISFLVFKTEGSFHMLTLAIPLSMLLGILISDSKSKFLFEIVHLIFISVIMISQFDLIKI